MMQLYTETQEGAGGGPVLNQNVWDGQGLKDPCFLVLNQHLWDGHGLKEPWFFGTFSRITKS
jgi:hypothetical protein